MSKCKNVERRCGKSKYQKCQILNEIAGKFLILYFLLVYCYDLLSSQVVELLHLQYLFSSTYISSQHRSGVLSTFVFMISLFSLSPVRDPSRCLYYLCVHVLSSLSLCLSGLYRLSVFVFLDIHIQLISFICWLFGSARIGVSQIL